MKILQVNCVYKRGSTGKIVADLHFCLQRAGMESVVCYGRGQKENEKNIYKICGEFYSNVNHFLTCFTGIMYGGCWLSTKKLEKLIERERPDIVHLHCINGYFVNVFALIQWLKEHHIKTVLTLHAEFMYTANCGHALDCERWRTGCGNCPRFKRETKSLFFDRTADSWAKMKAAFEGFGNNLIITSVSPWLMERAKQSPILADQKHKVVLNGLDANVFRPYDTANLKKKHGISGERIIFHVTPNFNLEADHIKGGYYVVELAKKLLGQDVKIFVAGSYPERIQVPPNMVLLGRISDQKLLAQYYSMADITVLTSKKETFSMVTAESLSCGTPVAGFFAGAPEQISIGAYSCFVEYGDLSALERGIKEMLSRPISKEEVSKKAHAKYKERVMCAEYIKIYKELHTNSHEMITR